MFTRVLRQGWEGNDWRCRFAALKCLCNMMGAVQSPAAALMLLDETVAVLEATFRYRG